MNINDKNDVYDELYRAAKITNEDLKQFEEFSLHYSQTQISTKN